MGYNIAIARAGGHETAKSDSHGTKPERHRHHEQTQGHRKNQKEGAIRTERQNETMGNTFEQLNESLKAFWREEAIKRCATKEEAEELIKKEAKIITSYK